VKQRIAKSLVLVAALMGLAAPCASADEGVINTFDADVLKQDGKVVTQAGSTPYNGITDFTIENNAGVPTENVKNVRVDLPPGLISNPEAAPKCPRDDFPTCPSNTQIGEVELGVPLLPPQPPYASTQQCREADETPGQHIEHEHGSTFARRA